MTSTAAPAGRPVRYLAADWPAPVAVRALTTLRGGGVSAPPYHSLNLADHIGDRTEAVRHNRRLLRGALGLPAEPVWLRQHHGAKVIDAADAAADRSADGACTDRPGVVCAVLTADCLPIVLCDRDGRRVAALHGGWRGLAGGIIEAGIERMRLPGAGLLAWLGPAIGPHAYEVGEEVRAAFLTKRPLLAAAFTPTRPGHYHADLYAIARTILAGCGVGTIHGGGRCTRREPGEFYSYRRDGDTGRMATLAWLEQTAHG